MKMNGLFPAFVKKEFLHIFRDRRTVLILLVMPVVQIILYGFALSTEVKNINIAVFAPAADEMTRRLTGRIEAGEPFASVTRIESPDEIDRVFQRGEADFVIVFPPSTESSLFTAEGARIRLIADAADTNTATAVTGYVNAVVRQFFAEEYPDAPPRGIQPVVQMLYNPQMKSSYTFVPGVMGLIMILICAMMTSVSIVREKESGTMEVLLASPVRPVWIVLSKMIPYFAASCVSFVLIVLLSVFLLDIPVAGSVAGLCVLSLLYLAVSLSLGLLISTLVDTQMAALLASGMALMMPVVFLSGMIFPVESMPTALQWISRTVPAYWYIAAVKRVMIEGAPAAGVAKELAILLAMAAGLIAVSLKKFKYRLA